MRRFGAEIATDRASVQAFVDERLRTYRDAADRIKSLLGRDLTRITDKFATSYIAGCLAIRYQILPFTEAEILAGAVDLRARPRGVRRSGAGRRAGTS